jgi:hypothetical protein
MRNNLSKSVTPSLSLTRTYSHPSHFSSQIAMIAPRLPSATLASVLPAQTLAQNMTANDNRVGWVSSSSGRSTSDILWSCFSILLVCTYKCIHFNVPSQNESEAGLFKWYGVYLPEKLLWRKWLKKVAWIMFIVLMPELGVAMAVDQYLLARACRHNWEQKNQEGRELEVNLVEEGTKDVEMTKIEEKVDEGERQKITNTHALFANMGGFTLRIFALFPPERDHTQKEQISKDDISPVSPPEQDHSQSDQNLRDHIPSRDGNPSVIDEASATVKEVSVPVRDWRDLGQYSHILQSSYGLTSGLGYCSLMPYPFLLTDLLTQLSFFLYSRLIIRIQLTNTEWSLNTFPNLKLPSKKEINELSKADAFTKAFACIQSGWLIIQSIVRISVGLPITQLELATMAFVVCALIMYLLWWAKPFGVECRATIIAIANNEIDKRAVAQRLSAPYDKYGVGSRPRNLHYFEKVLEAQSRIFPFPDEIDQIKKDIAEWDRQFHQPDLTWNKFRYLAIGENTFSGTGLILFGRALGAIVGTAFGRSRSIQPPRDDTVTLAFYATGTLFSAFHIAAWNWEFPSSTVRMLWRIFGVAATSVSPFTILFVFLVLMLNRINIINVPSKVAFTILSFMLMVYVISRIGLVVLVFYCFSSMPADVYKTINWLQFLPHFA